MLIGKQLQPNGAIGTGMKMYVRAGNIKIFTAHPGESYAYGDSNCPDFKYEKGSKMNKADPNYKLHSFYCKLQLVIQIQSQTLCRTNSVYHTKGKHFSLL